ncbi:MAG: hydroxyacid dehydrogenase [Aigarchaeota archaeon]|nr:hydroxyacid dehydrogenase [Aigarchaeota archaeon]MDW8093244.1 hydroxyacid dehydrogenase [Nitrososphaerota archaeon]
MYKVLVAFDIDRRAVEYMERNGISVEVRSDITQEEFDNVYHKYDAVVVRGNIKVRPSRGRGELDVIVRAGVGLDNIDLKGFSELGVEVLNTPEASTNSVAELTICLMICLARRLLPASSSLKQGKWMKAGVMGEELRGKTLGVVGCGRIGRAVSRLGSCLGMKVLVYDVVNVDEDFLRSIGARQVELRELLSQSDFVTVHVPLEESTRHLLGEEELRMMKRSAYLINVARGGVVDEGALKRALMEGRIAGAALDVFEREPPDDLELLSLPNLLPTPHIGAQTQDAQTIAGLRAAELVVSSLIKV